MSQVDQSDNLIPAAAYAGSGVRHAHLVGDLRRPAPHPFFRDEQVELIATCYQAGDDGIFHWHRHVTEYEMLLEGRIGYLDATSGAITWMAPGDLHRVVQGRCVRRLVPMSSRTLAVKAPSVGDDKVHCPDCDRPCPRRTLPFLPEHHR